MARLWDPVAKAAVSDKNFQLPGGQYKASFHIGGTLYFVDDSSDTIVTDDFQPGDHFRVETSEASNFLGRSFIITGVSGGTSSPTISFQPEVVIPAGLSIVPSRQLRVRATNTPTVQDRIRRVEGLTLSWEEVVGL